jgi:hypothetical protein
MRTLIAPTSIVSHRFCRLLLLFFFLPNTSLLLLYSSSFLCFHISENAATVWCRMHFLLDLLRVWCQKRRKKKKVGGESLAVHKSQTHLSPISQ